MQYTEIQHIINNGITIELMKKNYKKNEKNNDSYNAFFCTDSIHKQYEL